MRLDAHQHFWHYDPRRDAWITDEMAALKRDFLPQELARELATNGIDASVAVQADQSEAETDFLLSLAARHAEIAAVVGWVDLCAPNVAERLRYFSQFEKLRGFRHIVQAEPEDRFLLQADFVRGLRALHQFGFSYDLLLYPRQLAAAVELAGMLPEQRFVLDHIGKPPIKSGALAGWRERIADLAAQPNVFCKLSGLVTEADWRAWKVDDFKPYLDVVFAAFGPERLMFGSDWPVCLLAGRYGQVKEIVADYVRQHAREHEAAIFGDNAMRFYGVKTAAWTCN